MQVYFNTSSSNFKNYHKELNLEHSLEKNHFKDERQHTGYESREGMPQNCIQASTVKLLDTYQRCGLKRKLEETSPVLSSTAKRTSTSVSNIVTNSTSQIENKLSKQVSHRHQHVVVPHGKTIPNSHAKKTTLAEKQPKLLNMNTSSSKVERIN